MRRLRKREVARLTGQSGFTLIELSVAMFVILIVMLSLIAVFVGSLGTVALAKQRQTATALATQAMEQMRSIDPALLLQGSACTDTTLATDTNITGSCGSMRFAPLIGGISEPLRTNPTSATAPLSPHSVTVTSTNDGGQTYLVSAYVTSPCTFGAAGCPVATGPGANVVNLTTLVTWTSGASKGLPKTEVQRSLSYSPSRCAASATHPYAGSCQASFSGSAGLSLSSISLTNATDATLPVPGFTATGTSVQLSPPNLAVNLAVEQVSKLDGTATTSAASQTSGSPTSSGGLGATASADDDPSSAGTNATSSGTTAAQTAGAQTLTGIAGTLSATPSTTDSGGVAAKVTADATCVDTTNTALPVTGQPCTVGSVQSTGTGSGLTYTSSVVPKTFQVASIAASPSPARAVVARKVSTGGTSCAATSGVGCVIAQVSRSLGAFSAGALPSGGTAPAAVAGGTVAVTGITERAVTESGVGTASSSYSRTAGTLSYWNGSAMTAPISLVGSPATDTTYTSPALAASYAGVGGPLVVTVSSTVKVGAPVGVAPTTTGTAPCRGPSCNAKALASSAVTVATTYTATLNGVPLTSFKVTTDLGSLTAQTTYLAAFDG
jgi:prepilin-type N-terminal cleavage/methylation domain-containing protein